MSKLLIVGTVAFDAIKTPFGETDKILGGAGTYIALSASQFDIESGVVSVVGDDFPQNYLDLLTDRNVNLEGLEIVKGGKTFFWSGRYHNDMNTRDTLDTQLNVLADFEPNVPKNFQDSDIVMLGNLHPAVQLSVIEQVKNPKLIVLDTMNFWMDSELDLLKQVISKVDVITINDEEARQLSGEYSLVKAARKIRDMGPDYVVIKKGEHGALLFHKEEMFFAPALPLEEVFDPTGAGDTFAGGFVGYLTNTNDISFENMKNAVIYGSNLASFCVEKFGTEKMLNLDKHEVDKRLESFQALTQFEINLA
ncbi:PfkB family carbohydrate kinase [Psychroflexus sp. CAK57W]|uniref:PfkB family carbohydrate kinase n=1 Tax=Psychroflexus curvus TaxID=2873595 RepID=UPI001CCC0DA8|nr:PfkB family carbohydrate kinase [Psychroflexus curvus]MBZ9787123.1 PfkB family carbohydrate kinase [Psychroflexus curvus]